MKPTPLKLISLNILLDRHYDYFLPFLQKEQADIVCLQEVLESNMPRLSAALSFAGHFEPMFSKQGVRAGIAIFTRFPAVFSSLYYSGSPARVPQEQSDNQGKNLMLLCAAFSHQGHEYLVGTTHFTWTPDGGVSEAQRQDMGRLLEVLTHSPEIVFCGDFNAPRGGEIWGQLATRYQDNIPTHYDSSLDPHLHRLRDSKKLVVDGLWSTPQYRVTEVRLVEGVSDHKAVVGFIERE